jgi:hypothetical protein
MRRAILLVCVAGAMMGGAFGGASAAGAFGGASAAGASVVAGANLLANPSAEAGAFSFQGWDAVTGSVGPRAARRRWW